MTLSLSGIAITDDPCTFPLALNDRCRPMERLTTDRGLCFPLMKQREIAKAKDGRRLLRVPPKYIVVRSVRRLPGSSLGQAQSRYLSLQTQKSKLHRRRLVAGIPTGPQMYPQQVAQSLKHPSPTRTRSAARGESGGEEGKSTARGATNDSRNESDEKKAVTVESAWKSQLQRLKSHSQLLSPPREFSKSKKLPTTWRGNSLPIQSTVKHHQLPIHGARFTPQHPRRLLLRAFP